MLLFITICCTDFYLFVLCSCLLIYPLTHFAPAFYSYIGLWYISTLHVELLPRISAGLRLYSPSIVLFWIIHLLIKYCTFCSFRPPTLLTWVLSCVSLSQLLELLSQSVSLQDAQTTMIPSLPTTFIKPIGWNHTAETFRHPHSSLYKVLTGATGFLFDSWTLRMGSIGCPEM
jgi:hypothetical protein